MKNMYFDNAATTEIFPEVIELMGNSMKENYGNPSSTHQHGRMAKASVENVRKNIAKHFKVSPSEIVFTSGGTEADNFVLKNAVINLNIKRIITTKIEHHAVLHTIEFLEKEYDVVVVYLEVDANGEIDLKDLEKELRDTNNATLVSLMWINNEIGNILPIHNVANLCKEYGAMFHSDTVQGIGHFLLDLEEIPVDFMVASAHKFHGPKGVGFMFVRKGIAMQPLLHGGDQERGQRSSTENVHAILGMGAALDMSFSNSVEKKRKIEEIKLRLIQGLKVIFPEVMFNGLSEDFEKSSFTILNVRFPFMDKLLLFNLDLHGVSVSGGSACQSGSAKGSHVLKQILPSEAYEKESSVRFSFSARNTIEEVDKLLQVLKKIKNKYA